MHLLVLGCGYLGQRVAAAWPGQVSALTRSAARAAQFAARGWQPVLGDISEPQTLDQLPTADVVLHAIGFDRSAGVPQEAVSVAGVGHALERLAARCQRYVYISSTSVYGQSAGEWVDEDSPCEPTQPGGRCCLAAEEMVRQACPDRHAILRLAGIYGPQRVLTRVEALKAGQPLAGDGAAWLNLIHVDDATPAAAAALQVELPGGTWLVCDDRPSTRREYYSELARCVGADSPRFDPASEARRGSGGVNKRCSNARLKAALQRPLQFPDYFAGLAHALTGGNEGSQAD